MQIFLCLMIAEISPGTLDPALEPTLTPLDMACTTFGTFGNITYTILYSSKGRNYNTGTKN